MADVPVVPRKEHLEDMKANYQSGQHLTVLGPSGRGKTRLVGQLVMVCANPDREAFYLHGKIKGRDKTIEEISQRCQMPIITHGVPTRMDRIRNQRDYRRGWIIRPLDKPGDTADEENELLHREFSKSIRAGYHTSHSNPKIVIVNEAHQAHNDLKLRKQCEAPLMRGRPDCSMWHEIQRGRYVSYMCYDQAEYVYIFKDHDIDNQRRYAEIGGVDPLYLRDMASQLQTRTAPDGSTNSQAIHFRRAGDYLCIVDFLTPVSSTRIERRYDYAPDGR